MSDIYEQHEKAFANVAAFIVLDDRGNRVATIAFKFPRDGAGRLFAYVHWLGIEMVRGYASGGGYDKKTAAVSAAAHKLSLETVDDRAIAGAHVPFRRFVEAARKDGGQHWDGALREAGFTVLQAV